MKDTLLLLVAQYGYFSIFGALVLGIVGLPIPDEFLMTFGGYLVSRGQLHYLILVLSGFLGSAAGMSISFYIGHQFGLPLLEKYGGKINVTPDKLTKAELWFKRFGRFAVTIGYFIPGVRHFTAYSAGISKWPFHTFALYAYPGGLVWVLTFTTLGFFMGEHWREVAVTLHKYTLSGVLVLLAGAGIWWAVRRIRI